MTGDRIHSTLSRIDRAVSEARDLAESNVNDLRDRVRGVMNDYRSDTTLEVARIDVKIVRYVSLVNANAEYHLLRGYFYASPSLILIITAIVAFVRTVIKVIEIINSITKIVTGENLLYWINKVIPGFQAAWNGIMNTISNVSRDMGWGVDGVLHLLNVAHLSGQAWGVITGQEPGYFQSDKIQKVQGIMGNMSTCLDKWQSNPGEMMDNILNYFGPGDYDFLDRAFKGWTSKIDTLADKSEQLAGKLGDATGELLAIRNDMPSFIASHIPQAIWDSLASADSMINDRLLPMISRVQERLDEVDNLIDSLRADASRLADRIAHPGDMLAEINNLPDYVRKDQLSKVDSLISTKLHEDNAAIYADVNANLETFDKVLQAMKAPLPAPEFMNIEAPERAALTGIIAEPRETWFVGNY